MGKISYRGGVSLGNYGRLFLWPSWPRNGQLCSREPGTKPLTAQEAGRSHITFPTLAWPYSSTHTLKNQQWKGLMQELERAPAIQLSFAPPPFITGPCKPQGLASCLLGNCGSGSLSHDPFPATPPSYGWPLRAKGPVFVLPGTPTPVLAVVVVGTGIALAAQPRRLLARLCLIIPQHISSLCTEGQRAEVREWSWSIPTTAVVV